MEPGYEKSSSLLNMDRSYKVLLAARDEEGEATMLKRCRLQDDLDDYPDSPEGTAEKSAKRSHGDFSHDATPVDRSGLQPHAALVSDPLCSLRPSSLRSPPRPTSITEIVRQHAASMNIPFLGEVSAPIGAYEAWREARVGRAAARINEPGFSKLIGRIQHAVSAPQATSLGNDDLDDDLDDEARLGASSVSMGSSPRSSCSASPFRITRIATSK